MIFIATSASAACTDDTFQLTQLQAVIAFAVGVPLFIAIMLLIATGGFHPNKAARRRIAEREARDAAVLAGYRAELLPAPVGATAMAALTLEEFEAAYTAASRALDLALGRIAPSIGLDPETSSGAAVLAMRTRHLAALEREMDRRNSSYYKDPDTRLRFEKFRRSTRGEILRRTDFVEGRL